MGNTEPNIVCKPSAFKHGVSVADIRHAIKTARYDGLMVNEGAKYLCVGFDTHGNPLEVVHSEAGDNEMTVFHAMKCRKGYLHYLNC